MPGAYGAVDPLFLLLAAFALEAYLGGFDWRLRSWNWPRRRFAELIRGLQQRLDRPMRGAGALRRRGVLVAGLVLIAGVVAGGLLGLFTRHYPFAWALELLLLFAALRLRRNHQLGRRVLAALEREETQATRSWLSRLGAADLAFQTVESLPREGLAVTAATSLERRFADSAVAPAFWFTVLGLPGLFAWVAVQRARLTLAGPTGVSGGGSGSAEFVRASVLLFATLRWPPARVAEGLLFVARRLRGASAPRDPLDTLASALDRYLTGGLLLVVAVVILIAVRALLGWSSL